METLNKDRTIILDEDKIEELQEFYDRVDENLTELYDLYTESTYYVGYLEDFKDLSLYMERVKDKVWNMINPDEEDGEDEES